MIRNNVPNNLIQEKKLGARCISVEDGIPNPPDFDSCHFEEPNRVVFERKGCLLISDERKDDKQFRLKRY